MTPSGAERFNAILSVDVGLGEDSTHEMETGTQILRSYSSLTADVRRALGIELHWKLNPRYYPVTVGRVAKLADARDLKSRGELSPCGFKSRLGH